MTIKASLTFGGVTATAETQVNDNALSQADRELLLRQILSELYHIVQGRFGGKTLTEAGQ
jgi:hypothetical protein